MTWVLASLSVWGYVLNINKNKLCFLVWSIANVGWIYINLKENIPAQACLYFVYIIIMIVGYKKWNQNEI